MDTRRKLTGWSGKARSSLQLRRSTKPGRPPALTTLLIPKRLPVDRALTSRITRPIALKLLDPPGRAAGGPDPFPSISAGQNPEIKIYYPLGGLNRLVAQPPDAARTSRSLKAGLSIAEQLSDFGSSTITRYAFRYPGFYPLPMPDHPVLLVFEVPRPE
jgi:hypothetical protein